MKLHNSSDFPDSLIREVYQFVKPAGVSGRVRLKVRNRKHRYHGTWYPSGEIVVSSPASFTDHDHWCWIRLVNKNRLRASSRPNGKGYLDFACLTIEEQLVMLLAHELRHEWQNNGKLIWVKSNKTPSSTISGYSAYCKEFGHKLVPSRRRGMVWGARGRFSERDADSYALRMVRFWRRTHHTDPASVCFMSDNCMFYMPPDISVS